MQDSPFVQLLLAGIRDGNVSTIKMALLGRGREEGDADNCSRAFTIGRSPYG